LTSVADIGSDIETLKAWSDCRIGFGAPLPRVFSFGSMIESMPFIRRIGLWHHRRATARYRSPGDTNRARLVLKSYLTLRWPRQRAVAFEALRQKPPVSAPGLLLAETKSRHAANWPPFRSESRGGKCADVA